MMQLSNGNITQSPDLFYCSHHRKLNLHKDQPLVSVSENHDRLKNEKILNSFSKREIEVLHLIVNGLQTTEIAGMLHISPCTLKKHRHNLLQKANLKTMTALVAIAIKSGRY